MKTRDDIIALALILSVCCVVFTYADAPNLIVTAVDERPKELTLGKYYEPHQPNIEPNVQDYTLPLDLNNIVNIGSISPIIEFDSVSGLVQQNGFAILELEPRSLFGLFSGGIDLANVYRAFGLYGTPMFVTADTGLYLYHSLFDETLKDIEEHLFIRDVKYLTIALLRDALQRYEQFQGDFREATSIL